MVIVLLSVRRLIQMVTRSPFMGIGRQQDKEISANNIMLKNDKIIEPQEPGKDN